MQVTVTFRGVQTIDGESTITQLTAEGSFERLPNGWRLRYTEPQTDGGAVVTATVRDTQAVIERRGETVSCMILEQGRRHLCRYDTPYGKLVLYTDTEQLKTEAQQLTARYIVEMNGTFITQEIEIGIKEVSPC